MNTINTQIRYSIADNSITPTLVEEVSDTLTYVGYPLASCTGTDDAKWLIKRIMDIKMTDGSTIKTIMYANGVHRYNQKWSERKSLVYKLSPNATELTDDELKQAVK